MKTAIIIAEYNPFHNGHAYQIGAVRELGFDSVAVIMSGNFVQRGEPAIADKEVRVRAALACGADLVAELPLPYAMAPAERFAFGGVSLANAFAGEGATLFFGSESGETERLREIARLLEEESVNGDIRRLLREGVSYAAARQQAVRAAGGSAELLSEPNDILGVEYIRRVMLSGDRLGVRAIERVGAEHDSDGAEGRFASASLLRGLCAERGPAALESFVPPQAMEIYLEAAEKGELPCDGRRLETAVLARLRSMGAEDFARLPDMSEGLPNRLYAASRTAVSLEELITAATTKRFPSARIRRAALSALLGIPAELCRAAPPYLRLLGMNGQGERLAGQASRNIPVVSALKDVPKSFADAEARATDIFDLCRPRGRGCGWEYRRRLIRL